MDTGLEFGVLGPLEVRRGGTLLRVGWPRQRALLAVLLCHANRVVSRDQLLEELLGDQSAGPAVPACTPVMPGWPSLPRCAGICRWRSGWPVGSWPTTRPGPRRAWRVTWPRPGTGWS